MVQDRRDQWCTAGLVIAPSASVHTVIPSCEPASNTGSSDALRRAAAALITGRGVLQPVPAGADQRELDGHEETQASPARS